MINRSQIIKNLIQFWSLLTQRRRRQYKLILILMVLASFAEVASIGAVLPFLAVITSPQQFVNHPAIEPIIRILNLTSPEQVILTITIIFITITLTAGCIRILLLWTTTRLSFLIGSDISERIYRKTLYLPYIEHINKNSSEIINSTMSKVNAVVHISMQSLFFLSSIVITIVITIAIVSFKPIIALMTIGSFLIIYFVIAATTKNRLLVNGIIIARESNRVVKYLQEGFGGIRDIIISGNQEAYCKVYREADLPSRKAQGNTSFISASPKYIVEVLGMILIALIAYVLTMSSTGSNLSAVLALGVIALAAQRILPNLQQIYASWASIQGELASFEDVLALLSQSSKQDETNPDVPKLYFNNQIKLDKISYRYNNNGNWIIRDLSLTIKKGSRVGFIGTTGSGKTTLINIIMGLIEPSDGKIVVDDVVLTHINMKGWYKTLAHVPQEIFLIDSSVTENIAMGRGEQAINHERVKAAAQKARISDSIESWPHGYDTIVGERGVRLSGGQRQRLGIARALYNNPTIIIFDEATSALDIETEQDVMRSIENLSEDLTVLIVAHRTSTLKSCDEIIKLDTTGRIAWRGNYQELLNTR